MHRTDQDVDTVSTGETPPVITAIVATRNRGASAVLTVESLLASDHDDFAVLVIDQSDESTTEDAVRSYLDDPRFRYVRSDTVGVGRAQNLAVSMVSSPFLAFTDDDCEAPADWLSQITRVFADNPKVGIAYTNVVAGPHDESAGFVPDYVRHGDGIARSAWTKVRKRGIGAGMAARRKAFEEIGGFDENMGPGAAIPSAADRDIAIRSIIRGWWVYETGSTAIVHHGFRTWEQGKTLTRSNWTGMGAMCAKPIRAGHPTTILYALYEVTVNGLLHPMLRLRHGKRPQGLRRIVYFAQGFRLGWTTPIDRDRLVYQVADV